MAVGGVVVSRLSNLWKRRLVLHVAAIIVYVLLTGLALDNLLSHFDRALPGDGLHYDYSIFRWDLWWMRYALLERHTNPFQTDMMIYPFTHSLVLHTFVPFWGILSIPLQFFMGLDLILNVFICASFLLTAYLTFLFVYRHSAGWSLSVLAGAMFAYTPPMISRAIQAHLNMLPMWWLPLSLLAFDLVFKSKRILSALALALCLFGAILTDLQYMMWVMPILIPYALCRIFQRESRADRTQFRNALVCLGVAVLILAGLVWLYPISMLLRLDTSDYPKALLSTPHYYSLSPSTFFRRGTEDRTVGLLIMPLTLAVSVFRGRKGRWLWLAMAAFLLLLALGPYVALDRSEVVRIPMPYMAIHRWLKGLYRCPVRFAVPAVFCMSVLIALQGKAVLDRFRMAQPFRIGLVGGILALVVWDYGLFRPFPVFFPKEYAAYHEIARDPRDIVLLEVPLGVDTGYTLYGHGQQLIYYQPIHQKRIPNGALSRMSLSYEHYFNSYLLLRAITGNENLAPAAADELPLLIQEWHIGYVLIHLDLLTQNELRQLPPFFAQHPSLCFWRMEGDLVVYRPRTPEGCLQTAGPVHVNLAAPESTAYVGSGWYLPEDIGGVQGRWAGEISTATLRLDLVPQDYVLRFRAWAYPPNQSVTVRVNDTQIAVLPMPETWVEYKAIIPATAIQSGEPTLVQFVHSVLLSPHERTQSPDERALGAAYEWISVEP